MNYKMFTIQELHLLHDSIFWECAFLEKMEWSDCVRSVKLRALQKKIMAYIEAQP
jgi:hypothetical protein